MISLKQVLVIHEIIIENSGGLSGVRDIGLLESSISRPYHTFDGVDLYPTIVDKAAALFQSIISNHPFADGNKRTAYVLMRLMLLENGQDLTASEDEKYEFVIQSAEGKLTIEEINTWIVSNIKSA